MEKNTEIKYPKARKFIGNSHLMNRPQDINDYASLMYNMTKCIGWIRTKDAEERMRVAIDSLAEVILEKFDEAYAPIEYKVNATIQKEFTVPGFSEADAINSVTNTVEHLGGKIVEATAKEDDND